MTYVTRHAELPYNFHTCAALEHSRWRWWVSTSGPSDVDLERLRAPVRQGQRLQRYAGWLGEQDCTQGGVYVWMLPRPGAKGYRVVHVGMARSDMASRVREHCYNQCRTSQHAPNEYCAYDRIHRLEVGGNDSFGTLGEALWEAGSGCIVSERAEAVKRFVSEARVLFLSPAEESASVDQIKSMEAVLGWASALLLTLKDPAQLSGRSDETTNSLPKLKGARLDGSDLALVAEFLNGITNQAGIGPVLPNQPRVTSYPISSS